MTCFAEQLLPHLSYLIVGLVVVIAIFKPIIALLSKAHIHVQPTESKVVANVSEKRGLGGSQKPKYL